MSVVESVSVADPAVIALIEALTDELAAGEYTAEQTFGYSPEQLVAAGVQLVGAYADTQLVGIAGIEFGADASAELKRFYVNPSHRRTGVADALLAALLELARGRGVHRVRLETGDRQLAAQRFYARNGFEQVARFGPYVDSETSVCLERSLG